MVSDHILKIVIEAEDRATAALERIESIMKRLGLVGTESFNKASGGSTKFNESVLKANSPLESIQKHLKTVGTTGVQSFNQLSASERKTLLEMSSLSKEARDVMQRLNEVGVTGRNTWNQLSISEQKALTSMNSLSQSTVKVMDNFSRFGMNATSATTALKQLKMDSSFSTNLEQAKVKVSNLGVDINSTKGKILTLGSAAKESLGSKFSGAVTSAKEKLGSLKGSISNASANMKNLNQSSRTASSGMGFLRSAASMTVGMLGYDLVGSVMETTRASLNARSSIQAFAQRLNMTSSDVTNFQSSLDSLQQSYKKIDMDVVGQQATDMAYRLGLPKQSLTELTETTAIFTDAMQRNGRSAEDSMLAMSDAMDGQFVRLKEIGIGQEDLMKNGWSGDINDKTTLLTAMNKALKEQHYDTLAQSVDNLDEAWNVLNISLSNLLEQVLLPLTPVIVKIVNGISDFIDSLKNIPDEGIILGIGAAFAVLGYVIMTSLIPAISEAAVVLMTELLPAFFEISIVGAPLWAIVAAVTAIGLAIYEVGKYFGWWTDVGTMIDAISAGVQRLWSAFINNPDVKSMIQGITSAFQWLAGVLQSVGQWILSVCGITEEAGDKFDIVRGIIDVLGASFHQIKIFIDGVVSALTRVWEAVSNNEDVQIVVDALVFGFKTLYSTISWVVGVISEFVSGLFSSNDAGTQAQENFDTLGFIMEIVGGAFHLLVQHLTNLYNIFMFVVGCIQNTISFFQWLYDVVINIPTAFQNMISFVSVFLSQLPTIVYSYLVSVVRYIVVAGSQWINNAINIARNTVNGVIKWICQLPGRIYSYIVSVGSRILGGGSSWVSNAISLATRTVSAVINNISSLPQKVFNEFMNIGGKINQAINGAVNAAKNFGNNIKNAVLGALGIHSPGIVQNKIATEFENTVGQIDNQISAAQSKANEFGSAILDGFNSNDMNKLNISPNVNANVGTSIDTAEASTSLNDLIVLNSNAFNNIVSNEQESMNTLTSDVDSNLNNLQLKEQSSLDTMTNHISKSMTKILDKTKSGLKSTTSTTQTNLSKMQNSTAKTTSAMIKAWEGMKNSIVGAAKKIKTNSSTWFDSLSTTISSFYNKLQHPGGAGPRPAGGGTNVKRTTIGSKSPFKKVNSSVVSKKLGIDIEYLGNNTTASNVKGISIMDLVNSIIDGTKGAGSWSNVVNPNVSYIKGKARNWDMKGPKVWGKYPTGLSFKVKEFENNVPNISFNTFKGMAEDVFSACNYDFYYDSEKYGSWQKAFSTGSMNCSDSTDALIWMANQCGLPASKVHGHWNQYGHYWANIAGHKMDTTGWMTRGTWTPSASHAGSPKNEPFENLTQSIKDIATDTNTGEKFDIYTGETVSSEVTVNGELKVIHEFKNLPKGVSAEEVARIVNETTSSDDWQKTLVNSVTFQSEDSKVKTRLQKKQIRARGV